MGNYLFCEAVKLVVSLQQKSINRPKRHKKEKIWEQ